MSSYDARSPKPAESNGQVGPQEFGPGKQTLVEQIRVPVQQKADARGDAALRDSTWASMIQLVRGSDPAEGAGAVRAAATQGVETPSGPLPHGDMIQRAFGRHDVSSIHAHTGPEAATSARAMGADAYATGDHVVLGRGTDLHTVAHEAAHVVQQRGGVQLKGGVGAAGDTYERHAYAVADRVVAGQSAADLLDGAAAGATTHTVQRQASKDDAHILENQASLKGTDVEIPALEGALLATRMQAVKQGLLSQASFDAGLALSQAMTRLQPAVAANGPIDVLLQQTAAVAAHRLFAALRTETADEKNFQTQAPHSGRGGGITSVNPYTEEERLSHYGMVQHTSSLLEHLPELILARKWPDAFAAYRSLLDGLDLWVADQLRKKGKGTPEEALGNAQQHNAQVRTGLEEIADKHATRLPALFHPGAKIVEKEKAAGRPVADAIPMNVYFYKDDQDGKYHLYDLTTPSRPHEQTIEGSPTAAMMNTFFEDVARYPEGEVRYTLPSGGSGAAATTGKTKWYEWVGYAGLAAAAAGLAFVTAGASVPATVCFAAGAVAGGLSAAGHLVDTAQLGTATTATVVLDVTQLAASFASVGALSITIKAGGAAAALAGSRWFVPLLKATVVADGVQLVALTDITFVELTKIQQGAGTAEDKQRATAVLLTQLAVAGGLTALSVKGARDARTLDGQSLEIVDQSGANVLRRAGEDMPVPVPNSKAAVGDTHTSAGDIGAKPVDPGGQAAAPTDGHLPKSGAHTDVSGTAARSHDPEHWLAELEHSLEPAEQAKLAQMRSDKTPQEVQKMFGGDLDMARQRVRAAVGADQERAALAVQSKERVADLRKQIADRGLMSDPDIREIVEGTTVQNRRERVPMLRDKVIAKILRVEAEHTHPGTEVIDNVKVYEKLREATIDEWKGNNPGKEPRGLTGREDGLYAQRGELDMMIIERQTSGKAKVIAREEIKTGSHDNNADARGQIEEQSGLLADAAAGKKVIRLEFGGRNITGEIDLGSDAAANKSTRGPAGKGFDVSLGVSASDLEALCKDLLAEGARTGKVSP